MRRLLWSIVGACLLPLSGGLAGGQNPAETGTKASPGPNQANEPRARTLSLEKGLTFLDTVSLNWTENRKCATCHTNVPHLLARSAFRGAPSEAEKKVRAFFESRVANWDRGQRGDQPRNPTEVVVTAVSLAVHDAGRGKLHPLTRKALDRMWTVQNRDGAWDWLKCEWPPLEHDDYYGAVLAAVGVALAPENYAGSDRAKAGLAKLKGYLGKTPAPTLHHKAWLLWASTRLDGLLTNEEKAATIKELRARQRADGGWSLPSLGDWKGFDGRANDVDAPSDGYATGLILHVLRQANLDKNDPTVTRGLSWLKSNQRESGRWFTRSLNTDRAHYISHAGTALALLALKGWE